VLSPSSGPGHGLTAKYYRTGDLSGQPALTRIDPVININGLPAAELGPEVRAFGPPKLTWSARWSGTLTPPATGEYAFSLDGGGTARLLVEGREIAHLVKVNFQSTSFGTAQLTAGKPVSIVVEHSNDYEVLGSSLHLGWYPPHPEAMNSALEAAQSADVAIVFAGEQLGEGMDKTSLGLPGNQDELIEAVAARSPHTVVVLNTSTPVSMPWLDKVDAVLEAWYPGQESGAGVAALLFGDANPGGRLPMTFPASPDQGPGVTPETYPGVNGIAHFDEGILVGYRWYDQRRQKPLFPFGFGLSYTDFTFRDLKLTLDGGTVNVSVWVGNVGSREGSDVVQVYVGEPSEADEPPSQLKGFAKVSLKPGEEKQLTIAIPVKLLSAWSEKEHAWRLSAGRYEFKVGESSRDFRLRGQLQLQSAIY
jgi:beta-glucosidase